ncbi:hypothetical protein U1Q18_023846 [Sarracenia purpurea var. burkii]
MAALNCAVECSKQFFKNRKNTQLLVPCATTSYCLSTCTKPGGCTALQMGLQSAQTSPPILMRALYTLPSIAVGLTICGDNIAFLHFLLYCFVVAPDLGGQTKFYVVTWRICLKGRNPKFQLFDVAHLVHANDMGIWLVLLGSTPTFWTHERKEKTGVDRFSLRQAVIFICATNRPDELDLEFVRPGRIDRRLYIGLPDAKQRVQIFGVHSAGKQLAEDVDFEQLVFRTVGYSGADIRNLVNEAGIMSVRKGHSEIYQQDIIDVLDKQLLEGMGVLLTEEEQQKCEESVWIFVIIIYPSSGFHEKLV